MIARGIRWPFVLAFLLAGCLVELSFGAVSCQSPLLVHDDQANEREFQNVYQCITDPQMNGASISTATITRLTVTNLTASTGTIKSFMVVGTATNDNAPTGRIGESVVSAILSGSAVSLSNGIYADITSISLTAGDWDVSFVSGFTYNTGFATTMYAAISTTAGNSSSGLNQGDNYFLTAFPSGAPTNQTQISIPSYRMSLSATTTVYAKVRGDFAGGGSCSGYGRISARRVR